METAEMAETAEKVVRKRERQIETEEAKGRITALKTKMLSVEMQNTMNTFRRIEEARLKRAVARRNEENPGAEPIVVEALTEQERAALVQEDKEISRRLAVERSLAMFAQLEMQMSLPRPPSPPEDPNNDHWDRCYANAREYWEIKYAKEYGSFEDCTRIPAMCFSKNPIPDCTHHWTSQQIFSVKVAEIAECLQWPLDVFGVMAVRDDLDHLRNIFFSRTRDNCQRLTQQDPYLMLTGPTRAVVYEEHVTFDVMLKVKGATESEDKDLSLVLKKHRCCQSLNLSESYGEHMFNSCVSSFEYSSKLSTLELTCGLVISSVEATISVRVVKGSWPDGCRGKFTASIASVGHMEVLLLDSGDDEAPNVAADGGAVELSRRVICVEKFGVLRVSAAAFQCGKQLVAASEVSFAPLEAGTSHGVVDLGFCKVEVTVAWSLLLKCYPIDGFSL